MAGNPTEAHPSNVNEGPSVSWEAGRLDSCRFLRVDALVSASSSSSGGGVSMIPPVGELPLEKRNWAPLPEG